MRTQTFARAVSAIATLGIVLNSSCAPANGRHTAVKGNKNLIDSHLVKSVQKTDGACGANSVPASADAKSLQAEVEKLLSQGTAMTADQLPAGVYTLTTVVGNLQVHNSAAANNPSMQINATSTEYDLYKESKITLKSSSSDISEDCSRIETGGQAPSVDMGRSAAIDTTFQIDDKHHAKGVISATYNLRSNNLGVAAGQTPTGPALAPTVAMNANMTAQQRQQVLQQQQNQAKQNRGLPSNFSLIHQMLKANPKDIDSNGNYTNLLDATNGGQFDPNSTATVSLRKLSETLYQVAINFSEVVKNSPNASASRQIILTYAVALSTPTSISPQTAPSASAAPAPARTDSAAAAPAPAAPAPTTAAASTTPTATNSNAPAPTATSDQNQQPAQSQQDQDAATKQNQLQQDANAVPFVAPNIDPAVQNQGN